MSLFKPLAAVAIAAGLFFAPISAHAFGFGLFGGGGYSNCGCCNSCGCGNGYGGGYYR